ncbi:hypothetical protein WJX73_008362 [Symbiochloris irregularis]|uniref:Uncharacterized protein n=1 Tax=Symbiochloris irregularis TaxID=706552 RepID=A0AAW1NR21_9CHLO
MQLEGPRFVAAHGSEHGPQLVDVWTVSVLPQQTHMLVGKLATAAPLGSLQHLKRVWKTTAGTPVKMRIILCRVLQPPDAARPDFGGAAVSTAAEPHLPPALAQLVSDLAIAPEQAAVPAHAPQTREQWAEWSQIWPITWRQPESTAMYLAQQAPQLTQQEQEGMRRHMQRVWDLSGCTTSAAGSSEGAAVGNACIIVDPVAGEAVAQGVDETHAHPLRHAAMVAIDAAAQRDLLLWPPSPADAEEQPAAKEQRLEGQGSVHDSTAAASAHAHAAECATSHSEKPYLCTGWDCYLVVSRRGRYRH